MHPVGSGVSPSSTVISSSTTRGSYVNCAPKGCPRSRAAATTRCCWTGPVSPRPVSSLSPSLAPSQFPCLPPAWQIVEYLKRLNPRLDIVVRTHRLTELRFLQDHGVGAGAMGEFELALEMTPHTLRRFGIPSTETLAIVQGPRAPPFGHVGQGVYFRLLPCSRSRSQQRDRHSLFYGRDHRTRSPRVGCFARLLGPPHSDRNL